MVYSYALYPALTSVLMLFKRRSDRGYAPQPADLPRVFILFAAYNEEQVIGKKLETILLSDYPLDKLNIWIGSDCSTDKTDEIVRSFSARHHGIALQRFGVRTGKSSILNTLIEAYKVQSETDDILILTDANVMFDPNMVKELVTSFADPRIGLVGANVRNMESTEGISGQERAYIQRENRIKYREGELWGAVMGAFGACYAIRPGLFPTIPPNILMEDFYVTMHVLQRKRRAIINPKAVCLEDVSVRVTEEYKRKRRISAGNFQNLARYWRLLFSFRPAAFALFSHKLLRWMGPFFLIAALVCSGALAMNSFMYLILFLAQAALLVLSITDLLLQRAQVSIPPLRLLSYFYAMNLALLSGFFLFVRGVRTSVWRPTERQASASAGSG